jgi:hypothetical protein
MRLKTQVKYSTGFPLKLGRSESAHVLPHGGGRVPRIWPERCYQLQPFRSPIKIPHTLRLASHALDPAATHIRNYSTTQVVKHRFKAWHLILAACYVCRLYCKTARRHRLFYPMLYLTKNILYRPAKLYDMSINECGRLNIPCVTQQPVASVASIPSASQAELPI